MRVLFLSDLHKVVSGYDNYAEEEQNRWIRSLLHDIDTVVITGDTFEYYNYRDPKFNPHEVLSNIFEDTPVICTLGNHEFFYLDVPTTLGLYKNWYNPNKYNVHFLDILGHYDISGVRFVGNVLWYDGSMKTVRNQKMYDWAGHRWLDMTIKHFRFETEYEKCVDQIEKNIDSTKINVLCTHCVPHHKLNAWMLNDRIVGNDLNAYSGSMELLERLPNIKYALCGHTHKHVACEINNTICYNVGNDTHPPFNHLIIEI